MKSRPGIGAVFAIDLKRLFPEGGFLRHFVSVSGSMIAAQVVSVVSSPLNSRLYKPEDYGLMALFGAVSAVLSVLATMRYEMAIPVAEDDCEAAHLLVLSFVLLGALTAIVALISLFWGSKLVPMLTDDLRMVQYLWFLPVSLFGCSMYAVLSSWATRKSDFRTLSVSRVVQSVNGSCVTVGLGFLRSGILGMIIGGIVGQSSGVLGLLRNSVSDVRALPGRITFAGVYRAARRHRRYPIYTVWNTLFNSVSSYMPTLILVSQFGPRETGYFSLSQRILLLPTVLIAGAMAPVFYSRAKKAHEEGRLGELAQKVACSIAGVNAFFLLFLVAFGPDAFSFVFGEQWRRAGVYSSLLTPWLFVNFIVTPLATLPYVLERQREDLIFNMVLTVLRFGSLLIGSLYCSDLLAVGLFGIVSAIYMMVYLRWLMSLVSADFTQVLRQMARELIILAPPVAACRAVHLLEGAHVRLTMAAITIVALWALRRNLMFLRMKVLA